MTSQERPVEEQSEMEKPTDNGIAVADQALPTQETQEEQAETAEQRAASSADDVERAESATGQLEATTEIEATERAVGEMAANEPVAEASEAAVVETPAASEDEASASVAPATAEAQDSAAPATAEAETPTTTGDETTEGASFTPVTEVESGKPRRVKDLQPGMELEGRVTSIALYGIFVDIGVNRDGLVHISEMSNTRIDSPSDVVQIGDVVKVRVKSVEPDGRRISLTMRTADSQGRRGRKKPEFDRERLASLRVGDTLEGTVTGIAQFGVFVDIGVGKDGLVHISELAEGRIDKAEDAVQVGQTYTFKILEVDAEGTRISLSLRRAQRAQRLQELEKGQILEGTISGIAPFGAFVDIGVGRDGLVHISELSEDRVNRVEDAVKVGDKVQVRVLEMEANSKRISLSMVLEDRPREEQPIQTGPVSERPERPRREFPTLQERQERQEQPRQRREERQRRDERQPMGATTEVYASGDEDTDNAEPINATLEDLVSKFGGSTRRDKKRRYEEEEEEVDDSTRLVRRQRDAIRRTLNDMGDDE